jgi:hypothetical protein
MISKLVVPVNDHYLYRRVTDPGVLGLATWSCQMLSLVYWFKYPESAAFSA